jgi:hypothetical protein
MLVSVSRLEIARLLEEKQQRLKGQLPATDESSGQVFKATHKGSRNRCRFTRSLFSRACRRQSSVSLCPSRTVRHLAQTDRRGRKVRQRGPCPLYLGTLPLERPATLKEQL